MTSQPVPDGYAASYGAYYVQRVTALDYQPGKDYRTTDYLLARVLDASGVSAFSTLQFPFDPLSEQVFVNEVSVSDSSGRIISTGRLDDYYVLDDRSETIAGSKKMINIPVPGLQPGCVLSATITRRQIGQLEEIPFLAHTFSRSVPVRESIVFVRGEPAGVKCVASSGVDFQKLPEGRCWRVTDPKVARWEPLQPPSTEFLPILWIGDDAAQWNRLVTNYLANIHECFETHDAVRALAQTITAEANGPEAKLARIANFVQTNLTYKAIEFGRRARVPNKPAEILRNKYGDCKDHALLVQQMLAAVDVPAYLALANHQGPLRKDLPSLDQFDHMIVYTPGKGNARFIDCTDKGADVAHAIPFGLAGREVLILDSANPRFVSLPSYSSGDSKVVVQQKLYLTNTTDAVVEEAVTLTGVQGATFRSALLATAPSGQQMLIQRYMEMSDVEVQDFKVESVQATDKPLRLSWKYVLKKQFHRSDDQLSGILRAGFARRFLLPEPADHRQSPFELDVPFELLNTVTIAVPERFRLAETTNSECKIDPRFGECRSQLRTGPGSADLEFDFRRHLGRYAASDYDAYRQSLLSALSFLEQNVVFRTDAQ